MNDHELPAIPAAASMDSLEGMDGLERVDWYEAQAVVNAEAPGPEAVLSLAEWDKGLREEAPESEEPEITVCAVELRQLASGEALESAALDEVAQEVARLHVPDEGVALVDGVLLLALPEGGSWTSIANTVERAVIAAGHPATSVHAGFGLADSGIQGQSLEDAVRLARAGAARAYAEKLGVCELSLADEAALGRDGVVAKALEEALNEGRGLRLVFQPKIDTATQGFVGAEALLRFRCDELGDVGPSEFFPIAARSGLLSRLEQWVFENAVPEVARFVNAHGLAVPISINVRGDDLLEENFVARIGALLEEHGLDPSLLRVEVSEADVLARPEIAQERLEAVQALGVSVALDDFGKEGSTLADLRRLPVDVVKVHRAFTRDLETDPTAAALIQGVMSLARAVGIQTVAVGVESWSQFDALRDFGCGAVQGFLFSPPLEAEAFAARLQASD